MYEQSEKNLLNSNIFPTCPHNTVNFGPLTAEIGRRVWAPQQISMGFSSWLRYCTDVAQRRSTKLCTMFGRLPGWWTYLHFRGLTLTEFCQVQNSLCVQVLRSPILAALLHSTRAICVSQTWWHDSAERPPRGTSLPHLLVFVKFMLARISREVVNSINTFRGNDILLVTRCNYV